MNWKRIWDSLRTRFGKGRLDEPEPFLPRTWAWPDRVGRVAWRSERERWQTLWPHGMHLMGSD